jgi:phage terminase small subunit
MKGVSIMNKRQRLFCLEYLKDFDGGRAYRAVYEHGKPLKNPSAGANRLLARWDVKAFLGEKLRTRKGKKVAESNEVMAYFTSVMRGEIDMSDRERNKAAEILAKHFSMTEEFESVQEEKVTIVDDVGD